ncbi:MAG: hypothetical protein GX664_07930 [Bacteroidales bacterium]|nr:hypothetical protein [Bacteroidales bacterium]
MAIKLSNKKRAVISYENMFDELREAFEEKYPHGYADYLGDIFKVDKPDGTFFHAVSVEIPDAIYLVKIKVRTDDYDDVEKDLFKDPDDDEEEATEGEFLDNDGDFSEAPEDDIDE